MMPDAEPRVGPLENRAVWTLLVLAGVLGALLAARILWQFRDAFIPVGAVAGGLLYGRRMFAPRRQP